MAAQYTLTGAWTEITETSGTAQNVGYESVELVSDTNQEAGEGITLLPGEKQGFNGSMYARSKGDGNAILNVVDFKEVAGGGDSYVLPAANASVRGGVKIGTGVEMSSDVLNLSTATASVIGGVKSSTDDLDVVVRPNGTMYVKVASNAAAHNGIYRGKDLTSYFNSGDMSTAIANGTFNDIFIGDYITKTINLPAINYTDKEGNAQTQAAQTFTDVKWYVAGIDSHLRAGDAKTADHHVALISANALQRNVRMNPTNDTTGGYIGSDMWRIHMPNLAAAIKAAFGEAHVLKHREWLTNAVNSTASAGSANDWKGAANGLVWTDVEVNIPTEQMVYGCNIFGCGHDCDEWTEQLPFFALRQYVGSDDRSWFWLRQVASASNFASADGRGVANAHGASMANASGGIRPVFLLR